MNIYLSCDRLSKLGRENQQIPKLLAHIEEKGEFYLVQEFIEGNDLSQEVGAGKKLSEQAVIKLLQEILTVLAFVHQQNIIHRDIKPANIMRRRRDGKIFLIDFGAVKEISTLVHTQGKIMTSVVIGTPGYMPSEQLQGKPKLASDVYAVGMLAIQALTNLQPPTWSLIQLYCILSEYCTIRPMRTTRVINDT